MTPFRGNFEIKFRKNSWRHRFAFCVHTSHFTEIVHGSGWNDALFWWQKVSTMRLFRCHFAPWRRAPKVCMELTEAWHVTLNSKGTVLFTNIIDCGLW